METEKDYPDSQDVSRYTLWLVLAYTAYANHRQYRMFTTWLPHLLTNTVSLLLPDAIHALFPRRHAPRNIIEEVMLKMARDNDEYVLYVAPLALGYILSHPRFNIYKGDLAEINLAGLHLDAIPHASTAFALSLLVCDTLEMTRTAAHRGRWGQLLDWGYTHRIGVSFGVLALITFLWEYSEYRIHHYELDQRGKAQDINMQWSVEDTREDVASNFIGWLLAMLWHKLR